PRGAMGHTAGPRRCRALPGVARIGLRERTRAGGRRRLDGPLREQNSMATAITHSRPSTSEGGARVPFIGFFTRLVGPAALTAAGMIGAGAVATRLLAGAWFGFDLLWVALYV